MQTLQVTMGEGVNTPQPISVTMGEAVSIP